MIRHVADRRADRVTDVVGCLRVFGGVFVTTGVFSLGAALFGWAGVADVSLWERLGLAVLGAFHLGAGLLVALPTRTTTTVRRSGVEWVSKRPFRPAARRVVPPSEVARVAVEEKIDSDGDATYRVVLRLRSGETLPLTSQSTPAKEVADDAALAVARRLQMPEALA